MKSLFLGSLASLLMVFSIAPASAELACPAITCGGNDCSVVCTRNGHGLWVPPTENACAHCVCLHGTTIQASGECQSLSEHTPTPPVTPSPGQ